MVTRPLLVILAAAIAAAAAGLAPASTSVDGGTIGRVVDGDTLTLRDGRRVRLVQIDAPELGEGECYSRAARTALLTRVPVGSHVVLEADPALDRVDRYGRLLRYVVRAGTNVNVDLVRVGAAAPYFYRGDRGRHAARLLSDARAARAARRGLWKACPSTPLDPGRAVATGGAAAPAAPPTAHGACDSNYAGGPHRLDGDADGWGCE